MANSLSSRKTARQITRRMLINKMRKSRIRTMIRKVTRSVDAADPKAARVAFLAAEPEIMRGAQKGILHKKNASRTVSRLSRLVRDCTVKSE